MNYLSRLCLLALFLSLSSSALALDDVTPWYHVEIIVFDDINAKNLAAENWPSHPVLPAIDKSVQLQNQPTDPIASNAFEPNYTLLPKDDWQLTSQAAKLRANKAYKILLHLAWSQQIQTPNNAKPVHIYTSPVALATSDDVHQLSVYDPQETTQLNGTIKISKTNYFNVSADLVLNLSSKALAPYLAQANIKQLFNERDLASFRLIQTRRLREGEIHYFDHPLYGMLVLITPMNAATNAEPSLNF